MNDNLEDLLKLQAKFEKENTKLFNKDQFFQPLFQNFQEKLMHQRNTEYYNLKQQINKIRTNVTHFKRTLQNNPTAGPTFVEKVKQTLEEIESSILSFKEKQRLSYEQLLIDEGVSYQEVLAYDRRIESWLTNKSNRKPLPQLFNGGKGGELPLTNNIPPAVTVFEKFLAQNGGHTGGWEEYDHLAYVRLKRKHQSSASFVDVIATEIPTHSPNEITEHDQWYNEYCRLLNDKKKAINEWKKYKQVAKKDGDQNVNPVPRVKETMKDKLYEKEKEERFGRLKHWKAEKMKLEKEEQIREEQIKLEEEKKQKMKEIERQALIKAQVEEYSKKKEEEKQQQLLEEKIRVMEERQRSKLANKQIHRFQERDAVCIRERINRAIFVEQHQIEMDKRLNKLKQSVVVNVTRDPNRLLKLTAGWEERKKASNDHYEHTGSVLHVPRRAVPQWRQGI